MGLDLFDDPQEMPVANKDDPIGTNTDKEPIKLTLRRNSEGENNEYYIASKDQVKKAKII